MKVAILDDNHIKIVASPTEITEYSNHNAIFIDNKVTFTCSSEPSSNAWSIPRPVGGSLFNIPLDISQSPFNVSEFLIIYIQTADLNYPVVIPTYNNHELIELVANKSGILNMDCECQKDNNKAKPILLYYAFKLSCSVLDIHKAITFWDRLHNVISINTNCKCNG